MRIQRYEPALVSNDKSKDWRATMQPRMYGEWVRFSDLPSEWQAMIRPPELKPRTDSFEDMGMIPPDRLKNPPKRKR
jgi:hypothetical protein